MQANTGPQCRACVTRHNPGISGVQQTYITSYAIILLDSYIGTLPDDKSLEFSVELLEVFVF